MKGKQKKQEDLFAGIRLARTSNKGKLKTKVSRLETLLVCPRCGRKRHTKESKYCFQCGKEL